MYQLTLELFESTKEDINAQMWQKLDTCDRILIALSGGKDSICCLELLIRKGYKHKIELHHHDVDGGSETNFFDWAITADYCRAIAKTFDVPIFFSFREGGMKKEINRDNQATAPVWFELPDGTWKKSGGQGKLNTRKKFPMPTASLKTRWCSSTLKISCMDASIRNQSRFDGKKICVVTGERAEESAARAKYLQLEPHRTSCNKREVWHCRPILDWSTEKVWLVMKGAGIVPHPSYQFFSRCSCRACIFLNKDDLATLQLLDETIIDEITAFEQEFNSTISFDKQRDKKGLKQLNTKEKAELGTAKEIDEYWKAKANSKTWNIPIRVDSDDWVLPKAAFGNLLSGSP